MLSALFEIDWVTSHVTAALVDQSHVPPPTNPAPSGASHVPQCVPAAQNTFAHYYLGYYIHSCAKMRYKAQFSPSELLCSDTRLWVPFDAALPILDKTPVAQHRLAEGSSVQVTDEQIEAAFDELMLQIGAHVVFMEVSGPGRWHVIAP